LLGTTAAEALNWLETHGITMISDTDTATIVTSSIENGQTLALTGRWSESGQS